MDNKTIKNFFKRDTRMYMAIIFFLVVLLIYFNWRMAILGFAVLSGLFYYNLLTSHRLRKEWKHYIESLMTTADSASKSAVVNLPIGIVVLDINGHIRWFNPYFGNILKQESLLGEDIRKKLPELDLDKTLKRHDEGIQEIQINNRIYRVYAKVFKGPQFNQRLNYFAALYWQDITDFRQIKDELTDKKIVISIIQVDNYDEVIQATEESKRPQVIAEIEKAIGLWAQKHEAGLKKFSQDKFLMILEHKQFKKIEEERFAVLDQFREIKAGNTMPVTLSIGVGINGKHPQETSHFAHRALDLALGRGGDQAVVKDGDKVLFYGGKSKAIEKRTRVKARIIAHALRELIEGSSKVVVIGHKVPDMDSLGAAVGVIKAARTLEKEAYHVFENKNPSIEMVLENLQQDEYYKKTLITKEQALRIINPETLLVVVDTHRPSFVSTPELLEKTEKIVVIDHHRRGQEFIKNPMLIYLEPYASSTCELITEILQYLKDDLKISELEANVMLAGIVMDTKNFAFHTGVRTFEAASFLRRAGADTTFIHRLFQEDMESIVNCIEVVKKAEILYDKIAVSLFNQKAKNPVLLAAQGANALLNVKGITASFVMCEADDGVVISGRSLGDINVQVVLERLGGGGHLTVAGAQLKGVSSQEAMEDLKQAIKEYMEEGED
ncbi:MAG: cyclic-di-AMP phosphodiesterase [Thermosediminibacterales bacterium]|nr:cyclic-di-AMP phosphodiesterase [Thermosediminibacterales bacterium]MDK2836412.1 cyclic-di-AMP phosphodiesterase [Thermosediminibacterales bacterium]